jgi:hypothetical protein
MGSDVGFSWISEYRVWEQKKRWDLTRHRANEGWNQPRMGLTLAKEKT